MSDYKKTFNDYLRRSGIGAEIDSADTIIVGYSGGADSRFLLYMLCQYIKDNNCKALIKAAHMNHMIRGNEADRDEAFCMESAESMGIPCIVRKTDVPSIAKASLRGLEETARNERYSFFNELCRKYSGKTIVATAHNADDNLETVIFNMLRGTGIRGMSGIPPMRDGIFVRPILAFGGKEIRRVCKELGLEYVYDSTNSDTDYKRNYIRHNVIPVLNEIASSPHSAVLKMSENLRMDAEYLDKRSDEAYKSVMLKNGLKADAVALASLDDAILTRVICKMYGSSAGGEFLEHTHISAIVKLLRRKGTFSVSVPGNKFFLSNGTEAEFTSDIKKTRIQKNKSNKTYKIEANGKPFRMYNFSLTLSCENEKQTFLDDKAGNIYNLSIHKAMSFGKIKGSLFIRFRNDGDIFRYGGMNRKVKKIMSEKKIPADRRDRIPMLCDDEGIIWIPGFPLRDGMAPCDGDKSVYISCLYRN